MAKTKLTIPGPELLKDMRWAIDQVQRMVRGNLRDDDRRPDKAPDDYIVRTPAAGIPARSGRKIVARWCNVYRETELTPGTRGADKRLDPILDGDGTPFRLPVYNVFCTAVPGNEYVPTALLKSGTRYVLDWDDCDESSDSSSDSDSLPSDSSSDSDSLPSEIASSDSVSLDSPSSDHVGTCVPVPTCTWWGRLYESGYYFWGSGPDLTMPQCRGIDPYPNIGCDCNPPDRAPAYDYEFAYTPCNTAD